MIIKYIAVHFNYNQNTVLGMQLIRQSAKICNNPTTGVQARDKFDMPWR